MAFPIVRRPFPMFANNLISVQPMSMPVGAIFYYDYVYGEDDKPLVIRWFNRVCRGIISNTIPGWFQSRRHRTKQYVKNMSPSKLLRRWAARMLARQIMGSGCSGYEIGGRLIDRADDGVERQFITSPEELSQQVSSINTTETP